MALKRTSVTIDPEMIREAAEELGTRSVSETVRKAIEQTVRRKRLRSLAEWDAPDLTPELLAELRKPPEFPDADTEGVLDLLRQAKKPRA